MAKLLRRHWLATALLGLLLLGATGPALVWRAVGLWRNESFFQNRPTSYWSGAVRTWYNQDDLPSWLVDTPAERPAHWLLGLDQPAVLLANPDAIPVLVELFYREEGELRSEVATVLKASGPTGRQFLVEKLRDSQPGVAMAAANGLCRVVWDEDVRNWAIGYPPEILTSAMLEDSRDEDVHVRGMALLVICRVHLDSAAIIERLKEISLKDPNIFLRMHAIEILGTRPLHAEATVVTLIQHVDDPDPDVRNFAMQSLGWLGRRAKPALPRIAARLKDKSILVRLQAVKAQWAIGWRLEGSVPVLLDAWHSGDADARRIASGICDDIGAPLLLIAPLISPWLGFDGAVGGYCRN